MLDIEVAGAVAPKSTIVVYFAPNTDSGFYDAIAAVVNDTHWKPKIISISWGSAENEWSSSSISAMNSILNKAANQGITVFVAAGDAGYRDSEQGRFGHVDFPPSSPYVTGCGGTFLQSSDSKILSETVWNDSPSTSATGGGISDLFDEPTGKPISNFRPPKDQLTAKVVQFLMSPPWRIPIVATTFWWMEVGE